MLIIMLYNVKGKEVEKSIVNRGRTEFILHKEGLAKGTYL